MRRANFIQNTIIIISLSSVLAFLAVPVLGADTKTAYTRDGTHFISKERMEENIRYEYAKEGDYREVQVPLDTVVVGASFIPENLSSEEKDEKPLENSPSPSTSPKGSDSDLPLKGKYPYAPAFIGLLVIAGIVFAAAFIFSGRGRP